MKDRPRDTQPLLQAIHLGSLTPAQRFDRLEQGLDALHERMSDKMDDLRERVHGLELRVVAVSVAVSGIVTVIGLLVSKWIQGA